MKTLLLIWAAVLVTSVATFTYVNAHIEARVNRDRIILQLQRTDSPQLTFPASELEGSKEPYINTYNPLLGMNSKDIQDN